MIKQMQKRGREIKSWFVGLGSILLWVVTLDKKRVSLTKNSARNSHISFAVVITTAYHRGEIQKHLAMGIS